MIEEVLLEQAETKRKEMEQRGETPLCIWESSVLEKPESVALDGLCSVRSSRVRRLARSRPGVFNRPGIPVSVRGFECKTHHEPPVFYGVERNDVETRIIPSTWREGGFGFRWATDNGITYEAKCEVPVLIATI